MINVFTIKKNDHYAVRVNDTRWKTVYKIYPTTGDLNSVEDAMSRAEQYAYAFATGCKYAGAEVTLNLWESGIEIRV